MGVVYMQHPLHGAMAYSNTMEMEVARASGWTEFVPVENKPIEIPSFLGGGTPLPEDFPGRVVLVDAGFSTLESLTDITEEQLKAIKGIGPATVLKILDALEA